MVAMKFATIAVLATVAVAAPTTAVTTAKEVKPFSWSQWVADIMNPDVVALTPEQAVEAYYQSINATASTHDGAAKVKRFNRTCATSENWRADVDAASKCVSGLAAQGTGVSYTVKGQSNALELCKDIPGVLLDVYSYYNGDYQWTAQEFAVGGGHIMDGCTWGGRTGGAIYEDASPLLQITLRRR
ncbi:hypothetical protein NEUTE1DRAFT_117673 [Neurospora tetrasperma FGSC 2508]|uniref:Ecp2 effector protein domain-containing protein n=1 Tax=Neurospora tetrasperma (strain FGSC 2508 / ATCC MYA-4615 / P0657) TaxID=510951 RepID=F8MSV4_NEUT8|nr:uncharacterized protein NEUTE1DRAFT_117673 [Neurospora tetrasperma FGSC 2508]EGO55137.1 hypothetical protein NEUTE1DRAFT_117673 [Neurospora tetrasperma FGSC 2508]EGZ69650.1 hypothetical protein NEUTE2DRAFT_145618 [Neurospora tetrasperma FGSC 2509]